MNEYEQLYKLVQAYLLADHATENCYERYLELCKWMKEHKQPDGSEPIQFEE